MVCDGPENAEDRKYRYLNMKYMMR